MSGSDDIYNRPRGPWAKIQGVLVGVLVGMLVLAFAVWGIEDVFRPNGSNAIVRVGDAEVSQPEFMDRFNDRMQQLAEEQGEGLTNQQAFDRGIPQQLVQDYQRDLAIETDADDLGIGVNNRDVRRYAENIEAFRNVITQEFDEAQFEQILAANRISRRQFEDDTVRLLTQRQTLPAIMGGIRAPRDFAERYNTFVNEIRRARVIRLDEASLERFEEPTEDDIRAYVSANQDRFTSPEYRRFLMLRLDPQDFMGNDPDDPRFADADEFPADMFDVYVSEDEVRDRFDLLVDTGEIGAAETRDVTVIPARDEETANAAAERLRAGDGAARVADDLGLGAPQTFANIKGNSLINPASDAAAFALEAPGVTVAPTEFGSFEVVQVTAISPAAAPDFEAERDRLQKELIEGKARDIIGDLEEQVDNLLLNGRNLEEVSAELGLPLQDYPFIDRRGTTEDGIALNGFQRVPGIAQDPGLLNAIFAAPSDRESQITPTANNGLAVFRVTDIRAPAPRPFEQARDEALASLRTERLDTALTALGRDVAQRLRDGEDLEAVASQLGTQVENLAIQRASPPRQYSPELLVGLLDGEPGDVARGRGAIPGTYEVAVLDTVSTGTERIGGQLLGQIQENLSEQIALDISNAYTNAILADKDAAIYEDKLRSALALDDAGL